MSHTELTFLIELLLNHKLGKATKDAIAGRIREIEKPVIMQRASSSSSQLELLQLNQSASHSLTRNASTDPLVGQAASTQAILARNPDLIPTPKPIELKTPEQIAHTAAAAKALADRQESINLAISGKHEPGRTAPRKF